LVHDLPLDDARKLLATIINTAAGAPLPTEVSEGEVASVHLLCSVLSKGAPLPALPLRVGYWLGRVLLKHKDEYKDEDARDAGLPIGSAISRALKHLVPELPTDNVLGHADLSQLLSAMGDNYDAGGCPPADTLAWVLLAMCAPPEQLPVAKLRFGVSEVRWQWWKEYARVPRGARPLARVLGRGYLFMLKAFGDRGVRGSRPAGLKYTTKDVLTLLRNKRSTLGTLVGCLRVCDNLTKHPVGKWPSPRLLPLCCMALDRFPDNATLAELVTTIVANVSARTQVVESDANRLDFHDLRSDSDSDSGSDPDSDSGSASAKDVDTLLVHAVLCLHALAAIHPDSQQAVITFFSCVRTATRAIYLSPRFAEVLAGLAAVLERVSNTRSLARAGVRAVWGCMFEHIHRDGAREVLAKFAPAIPGLTAVLRAELATDDATCDTATVLNCVTCIQKISVLIAEVKGLGLEVALDVMPVVLRRFMSDVSITLQTVIIIRNLATVKSSSVALVSAMQDMIKVLRVHNTNASPCLHVIRFLQSLLFNVASPDIKATVLPVVVHKLADLVAFVDAAKDPEIVSPLLVDACLCCLQNVCNDNDNPPGMLAAMPLLLDTMRWFSKDVRCVTSCANVFRNLAQHGVNCPTVATAVPALTAALWTHIKNKEVTQAVTKCFLFLSFHLGDGVLDALRPVVATVPKICSDTNDDAVVVQQCAVMQLNVGKQEAEIERAVEAEQEAVEAEEAEAKAKAEAYVDAGADADAADNSVSLKLEPGAPAPAPAPAETP
jgi:hypothetical protein